jgi:glyoxylase-like metal-dependent hydrolase (beta-lactamase superfamily II)/ferredoxin
MADPARSVAENVAGDFFVDETCIDCDTCRQIAPLVFAEADGHSYVRLQPDEDGARAAARALLCCPTHSIGARSAAGRAAVKQAGSDFPLRLYDGVWACGFNAESSFGAHSYLLAHPQGNVLIDSPRWLPPLAQAIGRFGGVGRIVITHRDDVADAGAYAAHFGAEVLIHQRDADAFPTATRRIAGDQRVELGDGLVLLPLPGHTAGSMALLAHERYLFSGDHLWWSRTQGRLAASRSACWHSWSRQRASMERLLGERFSVVLPGHGQRIELAEGEMRAQLSGLVGRMQGDGPEAE